MRIVHIVPALFDRDEGVVGGAERYAMELARYVAEQEDTTLVSFGKRARDFTIGKLRVRTLPNPMYVRGQRSNPMSLGLLSTLQGADVVHCHQQHILASSVAALACRVAGRKVFVSDLGGGGWDISSYVSTDRWYHGHLHISQYSRTVFGHQGRTWAHVIYGGVDTDLFSPDATVPRQPTVLYVGRLMPHKGIDDLVRGLPTGLRLRLIGQPYHAAYVEELKKLAVGKDVVFEHGASDLELVAAYREALCIVLPSVYRTMYGEESKVPELLGQTLLEGMACGAPAIATDVASLPEVVKHGVTGFIVPPNASEALGERISFLRDHPEDAARLGAAGRARILSHFAWPVVARRCVEIYAA